MSCQIPMGMMLMSSSPNPLDIGMCSWKQPMMSNDNLMSMDPEGIGVLRRDQLFSVYVSNHAQEATKVIDILLLCKSFSDFMMAGLHLRSIVNPMMFVYAMSIAMLHRNDCRGMPVPHYFQLFPDHFIGEQYMETAKKFMQNNKRNRQNQQSLLIDINFTGTDRDKEHLLSYWREDIGLNSHHWHWHLVYPMDWLPSPSRPIKDRKGELFWFMHNQMLNRYNAERLAVNFKWAEPLIPLDVPVQEGYYPHIFSSTAMAEYSGRPQNLRIQDVDNPLVGLITVRNMTTWFTRVRQAIRDGYLITANGTRQFLNDRTGIDVLGAMIESSTLSPNRPFYGNIHNLGHDIISLMHDPDGRFNSPQAVMGFIETAVRDPIFFRWHKLLDMVFQEHKDRLLPYKDRDLTWDAIQIDDAAIVTEDATKYHINEMFTFYRNRTLDVSRSLDFQSNTSNVFVKVSHLDHAPFKYDIKVHSFKKYDALGHVRIFIVPKYDDYGYLMTDELLRTNMIEMDRFTVKLRPGKNHIIRLSGESAVTIEPGRQWQQIEINGIMFTPTNDDRNFCGCGWPDHLLVPTGTTSGMKFIMFIMISDWSNEKIDNPGGRRNCDDSLTMCGIQDELFPDRRAMGFPIDRPFEIDKHNPTSRRWFYRSNMILKDLVIYNEPLKRLKVQSNTKLAII